MKLDNLTKRIDELIQLAGQTIQTKYQSGYYELVNSELFYQFRSSSLSFLKNIYGEAHP